MLKIITNIANIKAGISLINSALDLVIKNTNEPIKLLNTLQKIQSLVQQIGKTIFGMEFPAIKSEKSFDDLIIEIDKQMDKL